jgi:hypothetical protein
MERLLEEEIGKGRYHDYPFNYRLDEEEKPDILGKMRKHTWLTVWINPRVDKKGEIKAGSWVREEVVKETGASFEETKEEVQETIANCDKVHETTGKACSEEKIYQVLQDWLGAQK